MGIVHLLALLSCAPKTPPHPPSPPQAVNASAPDGLIGVRFRQIPEGMLVVDVVDGMGAAAAGMVTGDLVVAVDGQPVTDLPTGQARKMVVGPPQTTISLTVRGPLGAPERVVVVERRASNTLQRPTASPNRRSIPPVVVDFRAAVRRGEAEDIAASIDALFAADFGGQRPGEVLTGPLRVAAEQNRKNAVTAMKLLNDREMDDWTYYAALAEGASRLGQEKRAVRYFKTAESMRPGDYQPLTGPVGDLGGAGRLRRLWIEAAAEAGQRAHAEEMARRFLRTHRSIPIAKRLRLEMPDAGAPWTARLPPMPDFSADLLDGQRWSLRAGEGEVVMLTFWASWCGPCRDEMPEIEAIWQQQRTQPVRFLAVSIDDPRDAEAVAEKVEEWGLTFPVTHAPELGALFGVSAIPAVRVLNRNGSLHYAAKGYSPSSVKTLNAQIAAALEDTVGRQTNLGPAWSQGAAALSHFLPVVGAWSVTARQDRIALGIEGRAPLTFSGALPDTVEADVAEVLEANEIVVWSRGPIAINAGGLMLRAWDVDGFSRWNLTIPSPAVDLAVNGDVLWVATRDGLLKLSDTGEVLARFADLIVHDLASGEGGVWGLAEDARWWMPDDGPPQARPVAREAALIDGQGGVVSRLVGARAVVSGRFGEDNSQRPVIYRKDGLIIGLGRDGAPAFTWKLSQPARLAVTDLDGDGHDELLVALERQGLAAVSLSMP